MDYPAAMSDPPPVNVGRCPPELLKPALRVLHDGLPESERGALVQALDGAATADFVGLMAAVCDNELTAACWVQPTAGNTASVWPPDGASPQAGDVLCAAAQFADQRGFAIAQAVIVADDGPTGAALQSAGFPLLAELAYLFAPAARRNKVPLGHLEFRGHAGQQPEQLETLMARTYVESRDVPGLDGVRSVSDAIASYRSQGVHVPQHWYRIWCDGVEAATLLLAAHPELGNYELVYIGVVPEFRGRGLGRHIVEFARSVAHAEGAERLVLAVDAANEPALAMYASCGFAQWDCRRVYARLRSPLATNRDAGS